MAEFLSGTDWSPGPSTPSFGILPLVSGTLLVTGIAIARRHPARARLGDLPLRVRPPRVRRVIKPMLELLAGVPTIVFGYFALTFFTPVILQDLLGYEVQLVQRALGRDRHGRSWCSRRSPRSPRTRCRRCPPALREGAFGLGASKLQVSLRVVFPAALSGIVAAIVLGASRAIGETMIVLVAAGQRPPRLDPRQPAGDDDGLHRRHGEGRRAHGRRSAPSRSSPSARRCSCSR